MPWPSTSRRSRGYGPDRIERLRGPAGVAQRKRRLARTNFLCERCEKKGLIEVATVVDHIIPLAHGGTDDDGNTRNLCHDCHQTVTAEQFGHRKKVRIGLDGWPTES